MLPKFPEFKRLELSDKKDVEFFTNKFNPYSDFNFTSLWCWDTSRRVQLSNLNGNLVVRFSDYQTQDDFLSVIGNNLSPLDIENLINYSEEIKITPVLRLVPSECTEKLLSTNLEIVLDNDNHDYVYDVSNLSELKGSDFETHRNLINRFIRRNPEAYVRLLSLKDAEKDIYTLNEKWRIRKVNKIEKSELENESVAVRRIFDYSDLQLPTVCVYLNDYLIAYSVCEILNKDFAIAHFSKADTDYAGVYHYLINTTCKVLRSSGVKFLNYEQDLGIPELRSSKRSHKPVLFLKKVTISKKRG